MTLHTIPTTDETMASKEEEAFNSEQRDMLMAVHENFRQQLSELRRDGTFTDLLITCNSTDGVKMAVRVHKAVMCSSSLHFHSMLKDEMKLIDEVELPPVNSKILEALIDFMYTGDLQLGHVPHEELKLVPLIAQNFGIYAIGNVYVSSLCKIINLDNLPVLLEFQSKLQSEELQQSINKFTAANVARLKSPSIGFLHFEELRNFMQKSSRVGAPSEVLLQTAIIWVMHDSRQRKKLLSSLIADIDLASLPEDFVNYLMEDEVMMQEFPSLQDILSTTKRLTLCRSIPTHDVARPYRRITALEDSPSESSLPPATSDINSSTGTPPSTSPGSPPGYTIAKTIFTPVQGHETSTLLPTHEPQFKGPGIIIVGRDEANRASILFHSLVNGSWSPIEDLELSLEYKQGLGFSDDCVFFIGGEDMHGEKMVQCWMRNLVTKETRRLPHLQIKRALPAVAIHHRVIYAVGGIGRFGTALSHVESLDGVFATSWQNAPPLRVKRSDEATCSIYHDLIYVIGGGTNKCECYDRRRQSWQEVPSLPPDFNDLIPMAAVAADKLFAFNYYKPQTIYWLDVVERAWKELHTKGVGPGWVVKAAGLNKKIIALDKSRWIYFYDVVSNNWHKNNKVPRVMPHLAYMTTVL